MSKIFLTIILLVCIISSKGQNVGIGTATPHPSAALDISDSTKGILIPRMTMSQRNNIQNPAEGLMVYQSDSTKGFWYFDGISWVLNVSSSNNSMMNLFIGQTYQGGIIFYILQPGDPGYSPSTKHGLIASSGDLANVQWSTVSTWSITPSAALGSGNSNTTTIINTAGSNNAAGVARSYQGGGYTDWYLPSKDELNLMYLNIGRNVIPGFDANKNYWTSTEIGSTPYTQNLVTGNQGYSHYSNGGGVRAIRSF